MLGIDLVKECRTIGAHSVNGKIRGSYENMGKMTAKRPDFVELSKEHGDIAINKSGLSIGASISRYENPITGIKEHIVTSCRRITRMLFDRDNKSIGAIAFDNPNYPGDFNFSYQVFMPDENGKTVEVFSDGTKKINANDTYDSRFGINAIGAMVEGKSGEFFAKFFGK